MTSLPVINCLEPKCGACCMEQAYLPVSHYSEYLNPGAAEKLPIGIREALEGHRAVLMSNEPAEREGPCIWLNQETMQCRHYEHRPDICRDNPDGVIPGNEACLAWREDYGPGARAVGQSGPSVKPDTVDI